MTLRLLLLLLPLQVFLPATCPAQSCMLSAKAALVSMQQRLQDNRRM
jgi:hypothetical protein